MTEISLIVTLNNQSTHSVYEFHILVLYRSVKTRVLGIVFICSLLKNGGIDIMAITLLCHIPLLRWFRILVCKLYNLKVKKS